jgi:hypothetical protein
VIRRRARPPGPPRSATPPPPPAPTGQRALPTLREQVDRKLDEAIRLLAHPAPRGATVALAGALADLERHRVRWDSRMRVAVVGVVSTGKSTLVNAVLGAELAKTDVKETTAVVTWLQGAAERELLIYYKDHPQTPPRRVEPPTVEELFALTAHRAGPGGGFDDDIDYALFRYPTDYLTKFDLIDTPGLSSVQGDDSESTLRHLGPRVDTADALLYVFDRAPDQAIGEVLDRFQRANDAGLTEMSPLTAIGVLTRVEEQWNRIPEKTVLTGGTLSVLVQGRRTADELMADPRVRTLFYGVQPIASKIGAAAGSCTEQDFAELAELTRLPGFTPGLLDDSLASWRTFQRFEAFAAIEPGRRLQLYEKFTACGIQLACHRIAEGISTRAELGRQLRADSGLTAFSDLLVDHFGQHADLIKLLRLMERIRELERERRPGLSAPHLVPFDRATRLFTTMTHTETVFAEADALRALYAERLTFGPAETAELKRLFGADRQARTVAERLGLPGGSPAGLAAYAKERSGHWRDEAGLGRYDGDTLRACIALSNTYNRISTQLRS